MSPTLRAAGAPERLCKKVDERGPDECWPWMASRYPSGYGRYGDGWYAHRAVYEAARGKIPPHGVVRHACDHPWCVNPDHLLVGTCADNSADMVKRRRSRFGESHHAARLTAEIVLDMRDRWRGGESTKALAMETGISPRHAWAVVTGRFWTTTATGAAQA